MREKVNFNFVEWKAAAAARAETVLNHACKCVSEKKRIRIVIFRSL